MVVHGHVLALGVGAVAAAGAAAFFLKKKNVEVQTGGGAPVPATTQNPPNYPLANTPSFVDTISNGVLNVIGQSRGIRNNNPLNMKWNSVNNWVGQVGQDSGGYIIFDTAVNGVRAAAKNLRSYSNAGFKSIRQIITRWTQGDSLTVQNNYINYVSGQLKISPDVALNTNNWAALLSAMTYFENGSNPYQFNLFTQGVASAGV